MSEADKLTQAKIRLAQNPPKGQNKAAQGRIPPGQTEVHNFPVLDLGIHKHITPERWRLRVDGRVAQAIELDWAALLALPQVDVVIDFHCVTRWSQLDMPWRGVRCADVLALAQVQGEFAMIYGADAYSTNLPVSALLAEEVLIAHQYDGEPLSREHGGPVRLMVPSRYGWKSAKWLNRIEIITQDQPGFWEERGYHMNADPWTEQRFASPDGEPA